jgi:aryl-alcohol dehydrogenase-like predicted oxidoreductase
MTFGGNADAGIWKAIGSLDQKVVDEIVARSLAAGVNFFDTADVYSFGESERRLGTAFKNLGVARKDVVIATKVFGRMGPRPNDHSASRGHIMDSVRASLDRLQTDHIDLYQMHHVDRSTPWDEIWQAFDVLIAQGKVIYAGSSNFAGWHIAQASGAAASRHALGLVSEQSLYNLTARTIELEVIPSCRAHGLGVIPWSPLAGGLLGGALGKLTEGRRASDRLRKAIERNRSKLEEYEGLCRELGEAPADVALAWLLHQPAVSAPIIGPRTMEQLVASPHAVELALDQLTLERLDRIWPGPGGEAPEAYAW